MSDETFWKNREPSIPVTISRDTLTSQLVNLQNAGLNSIKTIGGKAANFAELQKVAGIKVPEGSLAIPFYYYEQHMKVSVINFERYIYEPIRQME